MGSAHTLLSQYRALLALFTHFTTSESLTRYFSSLVVKDVLGDLQRIFHMQKTNPTCSSNFGAIHDIHIGGGRWRGSMTQYSRSKEMGCPRLTFRSSRKKVAPPTITAPTDLQTDFNCVMCLCMCMCVCLHVHWVPGRVACRLKASPVKIR